MGEDKREWKGNKRKEGWCVEGEKEGKREEEKTLKMGRWVDGMRVNL